MNFYWEEHNLNLNIPEGTISCLCIESSEVFKKLFELLWIISQGKNAEISFYEKEISYKIDKDFFIIFNPYSITVNDKKIITKLYQEMKESIDSYLFIQKTELNANIVKFIEEAINLEPYPIDYSLEFDCTQLFKIYDVKFDEQYSGLLEHIINYIKLTHQVIGIKLFVFINLRLLINEEEEALLKEMIEYEKVSILLVEGKDLGKRNLDNYCIIDYDECIIQL